MGNLQWLKVTFKVNEYESFHAVCVSISGIQAVKPESLSLLQSSNLHTRRRMERVMSSFSLDGWKLRIIFVEGMGVPGMFFCKKKERKKKNWQCSLNEALLETYINLNRAGLGTHQLCYWSVAKSSGPTSAMVSYFSVPCFSQVKNFEWMSRKKKKKKKMKAPGDESSPRPPLPVEVDRAESGPRNGDRP